MIIAIDGYEANVGQRVGIGRYAYDILSNMHTILSKSNGCGHKVRVYLPSPPLADMPNDTPWWKYRVAKPAKLWTFIGFPYALMKDMPRADVIFSPTHYIPRFTNIQKVMAIMDMSYLKYPEMFRAKDLYQLTHWTRYAALHSRKVLTISEFSKNAIITSYGLAEKNVVVTYPGLSMSKTTVQTKTPEQLRKDYGVGKHFILSVGTIQPRKNYVRLIEAFGKFLESNKQKFGDIQLVIIGKKGWLFDSILEAPKKYGVEGKVKFLHTVPDDDLPFFYENALCFALPSLYEGFGLPALEAMAYACPVVVSNISSLPEITGPAGIYVDPNDTKSITDGLLTAVRQRNLIQGRSRITKGLAQVKKFSWEEAARKTLTVLEEAASR